MFLKANSPHASAVGKSVIGFNVINGREIEGDLGMIESRSAADSRDLVGMFPDSGEKDVARAAKAAADALPSWSCAPAAVRLGVLDSLREILTLQQDRLARVIVREVGFTGAAARWEVQMSIEACRLLASDAPAQGTAGARGAGHRPAGVCGLLASGRFPLALPAEAILGALLRGNTVLWKPSDSAPTIAYLLMQALMDAGLPPGVVNTVNGRGRAACGKHFLAAVAKGSCQGLRFAGSRGLARSLGEACAGYMLPARLEAAAPESLIVMPDADLDLAVREVTATAFGGAGRPLGDLRNILLHEACAADFKGKLLAALERLEQGNPTTHPDAAIGPLLSTRSAAAFREHWESGRGSGATLLAGGEAWTEANRTERVRGHVANGAYLQPCVWDGVTPAMGLFQEVVPGPTVNLVPVKDFEEALACANAATRGPSASLYTGSRPWIGRFLSECRARLLRLNGGGAPQASGPDAADLGWCSRRQIVVGDAGGEPEATVAAAGTPPARPVTNWSDL